MPHKNATDRCLVTLVHAAALLAGAVSSPAGAFDLLKYFPTPNGAAWEYRYTESWSTGACSGKRMLSVGAATDEAVTFITSTPEADKCSGANAARGFPPTTDTLGVSLYAYRLVSRNSAIEGATSTTQWMAPLLFLPTFSNVYQTYSSEGMVSETLGDSVRSASYTATVKVIGLEDVNVPAGKFTSTVHVQLVERRTYPPPLTARVVTRTDRWLAREVGVVRLKVEVFVDEQRTESRQLQLLRAQLPAPPADE